MRYIILFLISLNFCFAQNPPISFASDKRIKHVAYRDNDVIPIEGIPLTTTEIIFPNGENILDIEGGDSTAWMVTFHPNLANILFIKPTTINSDSNMTVVTNRHAYYFHLKSNKNLNDKTYAVKIEVPTVTRAPVKPVAKRESVTKVMNAHYRFSGNPRLVPIHVFDDGQFTYFELAKNAPVPAIFAVDDKSGKESTVNTRREGKYLVVLRLAPQFTLRSGGIVTSIFNDAEIAEIQAHRRPQ